jgi:hypothetical protein
VASPTVTQALSDELPTFTGLLATCNRTIKALEAGQIAPPVGNAIHNGVGTVVRIVKLELEAAKMLNRAPTMLPRMLPAPTEERV